MPLRVHLERRFVYPPNSSRLVWVASSGDLKGPQLMSPSSVNQDAIHALAEAAVRERVVKVEAIVAAQNAVNTAEEEAAEQKAKADAAIKEAEAIKRAATKDIEVRKKAVTTALREALAAGWTASELRDVGLTVPTSVISASSSSTSEPRKRSVTRQRRVGLHDAPATDVAAAHVDSTPGTAEENTSAGERNNQSAPPAVHEIAGSAAVVDSPSTYAHTG